MIITAFLKAYASPLIFLGIILLPVLLKYIRTPRQRARIPLSQTGSILILLHTAYHLLNLSPPFDIFSNRPISTSNALIRLPRTPLNDVIVDKLKLFDNRIAYIRYGHKAFRCLWCSPSDHALVAIPGILGTWVTETIWVGLMSDHRTRPWRSTLAWSCVSGCVAEMAVKWGWELRVTEGDCLHVCSSYFA